jgi:hypothetical protein
MIRKELHDGTLELLKEYGIPATRENYVRLAFAGDPPDEPLDGEIEAELEQTFNNLTPVEQRQWLADAWIQ